MSENAPYTGGNSPGAKLYAVDGDFTKAAPCGPPIVANQFKGGDSPISFNSVVLMNWSDKQYHLYDIGTGQNIQPFRPIQSSIVFDQEFMVAQAHYRPLPLNTPYDEAWSIGWANTYVDLGACFLVEEFQIEDQGGGIVRFRRRYANLPPQRNVMESYNCTFPMIDYGGGSVRWGFTRVCATRVYHDYLVVDQLDILKGRYVDWSSGGPRLDAVSGILPNGIIIPEMRYYKAEVGAVANHNYLQPGQALSDAGVKTTPSATDYLSWVDGRNEICIEPSILRPYMGNIIERQTRFVIAQ